MSAQNSGMPEGPKPRKRANPLRPLRQKPKGNPLVAPRRPTPKPAVSAAKPSNSQNVPQLSPEAARKQNGGWSEPKPEDATDIPIMMSKKALLDGIRYHIMKFVKPNSLQQVDPTDQDEFARPVTLHRRDARQPPAARVVKEEVERTPPPQKDEAELEAIAQVKAAKEAQRAIDQAKMAPVAKDPNPKKPKKQKEEKTMFNRGPKTEAAKKESELRYEEALPWHLEDVDGKNVWVGNYVASLSEANVAFMIDNSVFRMVPLEKWYRFTSKPSFKAFSLEEAEEMMSRKMEPGRWVMKDVERKEGEEHLNATRRVLTGRGRMVKTESDTFKAASRSEKLEHDELDVSGDEFQDDDEAPTFERNDDEDSRDTKDRIRREQLGANLFGDGDEQEVDKELQAELKEELEREKYGKSTKKALIKRDHENIYESDNSADNPWSSSSDEDSSDDEEDKDKEKDTDKDKEKEGDAKDEDGNAVAGDGDAKAKAANGKSGTPQAKKGSDGKKVKSLKRPGSPGLSESSGNESTRKKLKKSKNSTPVTGSRVGTPQPHVIRRKPPPAASGSDGEATAGEMSDGAARKIKLKGSAKGTPSASRAASPTASQGNGSPVLSPGASSEGIITVDEIKAQIPTTGITMKALAAAFSRRLGEGPGRMPKNDLIAMIRQICDYDAKTKILTVKKG